jgi:deoxyribose-phosphate aldolase
MLFMRATLPSAMGLRSTLHGLPGVDKVGVEARAAALGTRSIKTIAKAWAIDLAIRMIDLTTLEGADTPGKVRALSAKALRPDPADPSCPAVAAICVYPAMVPVAAEVLAGSGVHLASVARRRWRSSWPTPGPRWPTAPTRSTW